MIFGVDQVPAGQSGTVKGTPIDSFPGLQGVSGPSPWDDTVLNRIDNLMVGAHEHGIKLLISIHSYNALEGNRDFYGNWYGTGDFYTNNDAISNFKNRIAHVLAHVNPSNGKTWAQSSEYIFAFEAQNEAMHPQVQLNTHSSVKKSKPASRAIQLHWHHGNVRWLNRSKTTSKVTVEFWSLLAVGLICPTLS